VQTPEQLYYGTTTALSQCQLLPNSLQSTQGSHSFGRKKPGVFQSNFEIFQAPLVIVRSLNIENTRQNLYILATWAVTRHSSSTFTIHSFVTRINLHAIQLLQCQNSIN